MVDVASFTNLEFMRQRLIVDDVDRPLGRQHLLDGLQLDWATGGGGGGGGGGGDEGKEEKRRGRRRKGGGGGGEKGREGLV